MENFERRTYALEMRYKYMGNKPALYEWTEEHFNLSETFAQIMERLNNEDIDVLFAEIVDTFTGEVMFTIDEAHHEHYCCVDVPLILSDELLHDYNINANYVKVV